MVLFVRVDAVHGGMCRHLRSMCSLNTQGLYVRYEGGGSSGLLNGGDAGFLEGIAFPVGNPYNKNVKYPVLQ